MYVCEHSYSREKGASLFKGVTACDISLSNSRDDPRVMTYFSRDFSVPGFRILDLSIKWHWSLEMSQDDNTTYILHPIFAC